jgi:NitT/TauT family transport system substrate-binding protein
MIRSRTTVMTAAVAVALLASVALAASGCGTSSKTSSSSSDTTTSSTSPSVKAAPIVIGTLATEDSLPLWVAQKMGYFAVEGVSDVKIELFQSAQERDAALAAGSIDAFMGDIIAAANLQASGTPVKIETIMLGADPSQGRFGIAVPKGSTVTTLSALANVPIATSSATIQEYVLDGLMQQAGVPPSQVKTVEVKKVPVRFSLLMAGKLKAAALPEPFLTLATLGGAKIIGDDTKSATNLSQTVFVASEKYLAEPGGQEAVDGVLRAWDVAVGDINKAKDAYRALLADKARLPKELQKTYVVNTYPLHQLPSQADVNAVLEWMKAKGYLKTDVTYANLVPTGTATGQ